jgi:AcrR family transcriptional regulator
MTIVSLPARGTRPANRRASILTAATGLIRERGYEHVSMGDIADAVGVGASALYRHFSSKQQLLFEVIKDGLTPIKAAVDELDLRDRQAALPALAELALDHTYLGVLWTREVRHLPSKEQDAIAAGITALAAQIADKIGKLRPQLNSAARDLLAWSLLGILLSPSFQHLETKRDAHADLLAAMMERLLDSPIPAGYGATTNPAPARQGLMPISRREALLLQATKLFAQRRYAAVGIEDVAASLGMAGPSIYNHFSSKSELLGIALGRGAGHLYLQVAEILSSNDTPAPALRGLIRSYIDFAVAQPNLVAVLITEVRSLTEPYRQEAMQAQRDYVNEWAHLLAAAADHQIDPLTARIQVQATLTVINTVTQVHHLREATHACSTLARLAAHLLDLTEPESQITST